MVNGNYIMYSDRPTSESEIVEDHVQTRTAERKPRRKSHRTANELQTSLAQLDNDTDSVKHERKNKEPRILRYVPNTEIEEHQVSDNYETYDLKTTDVNKPRRYTFKKKPKNPADGSVNYAYSRSSSSCSSPTGNLPTIAEQGETLATRHSPPSPTVSEIITGYENKLDKYFNKPREVKKYSTKGSHPDSLYRVPLSDDVGGGKMSRLLRVMRWPVALIVVCVALAVFVYFLMPDNFQTGPDMVNATFWGASLAVADTRRAHNAHDAHNAQNTHNTQDAHNHGQASRTPEPKRNPKPLSYKPQPDTRTPEIDFYDADHNKNEDLRAVISTMTEKQTKLPIPPVFPTHLTPEVQYGNDDVDIENVRSPKVLHKINQLPVDSTLKPHITQKPEKPLAIFFKDGEGVTTTTSTETAGTAGEMIVNNLYATSDKLPAKAKYTPLLDLLPWSDKVTNRLQSQPVLPPEMQDFYSQGPIKTNFTSGHSKFFGIGIEDAEKMKSTTQSSTYNTRVSPTLPTWRDEDTTTKDYTVNINPDVSQCRSTSQPLCRGVLPYDLASRPVSFIGAPITSLLPQIQYVAASNCSLRFKNFVCALLEPECSPAPYTPKMPCYNLCKAVLAGCDGQIPHELRTVLNCKQYPSTNCVAARAPCERQEMACNDGTCVPRDWICDGAHDCPSGEDENICSTCKPDEFRCSSGTCIHSRWKCDGYADCPDSDDEGEELCGAVRPGEDLGEESAGSAPQPAVHRPNRVPAPNKAQRSGDDSSKELLMTSDSNNALKRNYTRRPSLSRLTPYSPAMLQATKPKKLEAEEEYENVPKNNPKNKPRDEDRELNEDGTDELPIDEDTRTNTGLKENHKRAEDQPTLGSPINLKNKVPTVYKNITTRANPMQGRAPLPRPRSQNQNRHSISPYPAEMTRLDQSLNKLERVINGAELMKVINQNAQRPTPAAADSGESVEDSTQAEPARYGKASSHSSPCPDGELRCVDGRCITLAQLCDGTIDCSDHADEDNCYT